MTQEEILKIREKIIKERQRYAEDPEYRKQYWEDIVAKWEPFEQPYDVKPLPVLNGEDHYIYTDIVVPALIRCGAIPKEKLIVGKKYLGRCRNATEAVWDGKCFVYDRYKFGSTYKEGINHFQDDDGFDVFVPIKEL